MKAYKAFEKGLVCRRYQYKEGELHTTEKASCARSGFHAALCPLDCLHYYPNFAKSEFCIVDVGGDVDEDALDSKITGTEMRIVRRLSPKAYLMHCLLYMGNRPQARENSVVQHERGEARNGYAIVIGLEPYAKAQKEGDLLAIGNYEKDGDELKLWGVAVLEAGIDCPVGVYVGINGKEEKK